MARITRATGSGVRIARDVACGPRVVGRTTRQVLHHGLALAVGIGVSVGACGRERVHADEGRSDASLGAITTVSAPTGVGTSPTFAIAPGGARAVAWVSAPGGGTDARLYVAVNGATPTELGDPLGAVQVHGEAPPRVAFGPAGELYALYVVAKDVGRRFPVSALRFVRSADGGRTWSAPATVTDDPAEFGSHNFHALYVALDGTIYAGWLDGREGKSATYFTHSTDGGRTWAPNRRISVTETCPCCRTAIAADGRGTVYAAWRAVFPGNVRDVVVARSGDHGATWGTPVRVHADGWVYPGCPHAGPSLQLDSAGRVHVLWWTGKPDRGGVYYAASADSGRTFSTPVAIETQRIPIPTHVQLALAPGGRVVAAWDAARGMTRVVTVRVSRDGGVRFGDALSVSDSAAGAAQYPVVGAGGDRAYVAWSQTRLPPPDHEHGGHDRGDAHGGEHGKMLLHAVGATQVLMREVRL